MIRVAARYHRLPIAVAVGLTSGVLVVVAGMMLKPVLVAPVASPAVVAPSPVGRPPSFSVIVPFTTPPPSLAAPSLPTLVPLGSADSPPPPVPSSAAATTAKPTALQPTLEPSAAGATPTPSPLHSAPDVTLPPITPAPTQPPVVTPAPTLSPVPTPTPIVPDETPPPAVAVSCANGVDNGGGTGTICEATIFAGFVTVLECHGAAGDPRAACSTRTLPGRVTSVDMCNGTANGGGATLRCSVTGVGVGSAPVTLCVGSGAGGTLVGMTCTESGSSIPVNLCNGSGNGGGALLVCAVLQ